MARLQLAHSPGLPQMPKIIPRKPKKHSGEPALDTDTDSIPSLIGNQQKLKAKIDSWKYGYADPKSRPHRRNMARDSDASAQSQIFDTDALPSEATEDTSQTESSDEASSNSGGVHIVDDSDTY